MSSDLQKILSVLGTIQNDISVLKIGQELIKVEQGCIKEELWTMKAAAAHHVDSLSKQFNGVIQDFGSFGDKMLQLFEKWSEQADSRVIDKVMDIQGPRIRAMEDRFHEISKAG